jgi:mannose-6-phosphate isomerase-like protein (cupin superfamily)
MHLRPTNLLPLRSIFAIGIVSLLIGFSSPRAADELRGRDAARPAVRNPARVANLPEGPDYKKYAPGLYARRVFQTVGPSKDYSVEEWGLLVGPGKKTDVVTLPGAAVLIVRTGNGVIAIGEQKQEFRLGSSLLIPENQKFSIANSSSERPVSIKAVILKGR